MKRAILLLTASFFAAACGKDIDQLNAEHHEKAKQEARLQAVDLSKQIEMNGGHWEHDTLRKRCTEAKKALSTKAAEVCSAGEVALANAAIERSDWNLARDAHDWAARFGGADSAAMEKIEDRLDQAAKKK